MTNSITSATKQLDKIPLDLYISKIAVVYTHVLALIHQNIKSPLGTLECGVDLREIYGTGVDR